MHITLQPRARKVGFLALSFLLTLAYTVLITREFLADHYADRGDLPSLQTAARLQPGNAEYRHRLGRYFALIERNPGAAVEQYKVAVRLNPHSAPYWFDLASAYQLLDDTKQQAVALEHALAADPTTPDAAWQAANLYLVAGEVEKALSEFRVVLQNEPSLSAAALQLCWRADPDVDSLLQKVMPLRAEAYIALLDLLMQKKETEGTTKAWAALAQLKQPFEARHVFEYVKYLILQHEVEQATLVWRQAVGSLGYSAYLPSPGNLIVNGNFSLDVLNGGFDWNYQKQSTVELTLDPSDFHGGHRSLSIIFDGPGVSDAGIFQFVPVQPATTYEFSAYYRAGEIEGAGGPQLVLQDVYSGKRYFESDELKNAEFWRPMHGVFTTEPETKLLLLHVERVPSGSPIRGKLWIDDFNLTQKYLTQK
jgi:tetratricopeptide (TPR) repeat protein